MKKYEEQKSTCLFFARLCAYPIIGSDKKLAKKVKKRIDYSFGLIFCFLDDFESPNQKRGLRSRLSLIKDFLSQDLSDTYQYWCKELDGFLTKEEIQKVIDEDIAAGSQYLYWGKLFWTIMQIQKTFWIFF